MWWEVWSEEHERFYYHEAEGDETTWELPEGEGIVVLRWEEEEEGAVAADKAKTKVPDDEAAAASQTQVQEEEEAGKSDTLVPSVVREKAKSTLQLAIDQCVQVDEVCRHAQERIRMNVILYLPAASLTLQINCVCVGVCAGRECSTEGW